MASALPPQRLPAAQANLGLKDDAEMSALVEMLAQVLRTEEITGKW